jgi:hypothetical protein
MVTIQFVAEIAREFVHEGLYLGLIGHLPCPEY